MIVINGVCVLGGGGGLGRHVIVWHFDTFLPISWYPAGRQRRDTSACGVRDSVSEMTGRKVEAESALYYFCVSCRTLRFVRGAVVDAVIVHAWFSSRGILSGIPERSGVYRSRFPCRFWRMPSFSSYVQKNKTKKNDNNTKANN